MKQLGLILVLILIGLILSGNSPVKRVIDPDGKDVFIRGKLTFKNKDTPTIRFWVEGDAGYYSLVLFEENSTDVTDHLQNISNIAMSIFRKKICSSSKYCILDENKKYIVIDFNNKEIFNIRGTKLFALGYQVIKKAQNETEGKVSGYIVVANL